MFSSQKKGYVIFYGRIRIPGNFGACTDSVQQALLSSHETAPGFKASPPPPNHYQHHHHNMQQSQYACVYALSSTAQSFSIIVFYEVAFKLGYM